MNSRIAGTVGVLIAILVASSGVVRAGTNTITFSQKGILVTSNVLFGSTVPNGGLLFSFTGVDSSGHSFSGQMVLSTQANKSVVCTFTGPGGVAEIGHSVTLLGSAAITIAPGVGTLYSVGTSGSGCSNHSAVSFTEVENIEGGGGGYKNATGTRTLQFAGIGNLQTAFAKATGSATITVP